MYTQLAAHAACALRPKRVPAERRASDYVLFVEALLGELARIVDYTGRLVRNGKGAIKADLAGISNRLGSHAKSYQPPYGQMSCPFQPFRFIFPRAISRRK